MKKLLCIIFCLFAISGAVTTVQKIYQGSNESQVTSKILNREMGFDSAQNALLFKSNNGTVFHGIYKETKAPTLDSSLQINKLTAGFGVATDGSKTLISVPFVGSDSIVKNVQPTIWSPTIWDPIVKNLLTADSIKSLGIIRGNTLTASQAVFTNGNKDLISNTLSGTGSVLMSSGATATSITLNGNTQIVSATGGFYEEGSSTVTWQGFSSGVTSTMYYIKIGKLVTLKFNTFNGTSNANYLSLANNSIPSQLRPAASMSFPVSHYSFLDGGSVLGSAIVSAFYDGSIASFKFLLAGGDFWATSNLKGLTRTISFSYSIQ